MTFTTFEKLRTAQAIVVETASQITPWLACVPTAWAVGESADRALKFPLPVAICVGLAVEGAGIASIALALDLRSYNASRGDGDQPAHDKLAYVLVALYFLAAVVLAVVVEARPEFAPLAPIIFPILSLVGAGNLALRHDHVARLADAQARAAKIEAERQEEKEHRRQMRELRLNPKNASRTRTHDASPAQPRQYTCEVCGSHFTQATSFANHKRWGHRNGHQATTSDPGLEVMRG